MLDRWIAAKPWAKKNETQGGSTANSAKFNTKSGNFPSGLAELAELAVDPPGVSFLRPPLRMPGGRRQYRVATPCDGAATPAAVALVAKAKAARIVLVADGAELHIYAPFAARCSLPQRLAAQAADVLAVLRQQSAQRMQENASSGGSAANSANSAKLEGKFGTEGAAESASAAADRFETGIPRAWAEGYAAMQRAEVPAWAARYPGLWADLVTAVGRFLDRWGRQAAALGWDATDLFGVFPTAPLARIDQLGLALLLVDGGQVVAMTTDAVSIKLRSGVAQVFRKSHKNAREPRTIPIWALIKETKP
jgi:hypothetical protein